MNPVIYKIIHLASVVILFAALGAAVYTASKGNKLAGIFHGIALLLLLVSGFGLLAKIWDNNFGQWWVVAKLFIWLLLGSSYSLVKKRLISENAAFSIIVSLGVIAAILGNVPYLGL